MMIITKSTMEEVAATVATTATATKTMPKGVYGFGHTSMNGIIFSFNSNRKGGNGGNGGIGDSSNGNQEGPGSNGAGGGNSINDDIGNAPSGDGFVRIYRVL